MQSKKVQRREAANATKERHKLMFEARALLKESTRAYMKGDVEAAQSLRTTAANKRACAASLHTSVGLHTRSANTNTMAHQG